ncbi:MAG: hypothetical protein JNL94_15765 [Planctomycetes bacterium]|nr:hypothetical protein [Planctomycetota bacterium]
MNDSFATQGIQRPNTAVHRDTANARQAPPRLSPNQATDPKQQADPRSQVTVAVDRDDRAAERAAIRSARDGPDAQAISERRKERAERLRERRRRERADRERLDEARTQVREYEASVHELRRRAAEVYGSAGNLPGGEQRLVDRII